MSDTQSTEKKISLQMGARHYGESRGGRPAHPVTLQRHIKHGVKLANGEVIRLEGWKVGHRWTTSVAAIERFIERVTRASLGEDASVVLTPTRKQAVEKAARECAALGVG
jgi:hypothetical protein